MSQPLGTIGEVDQKALLQWAFQRRSEISKILSKMPARESRTEVETLISRVSRLETNLVGGTDPIEAWDEFVEFLDGEGADAWEYYLKQQEAVDKELQEATAAHPAMTTLLDRTRDVEKCRSSPAPKSTR
jgi:hypothetical protein